MNKQQLFDKIKLQTGQDFSRNRGIRSYIAKITKSDSHPWYGMSVEALYNAFIPHTDLLTAMAAAVTCANKYHNGGQISGFSGQFIFPEEQLEAIVNNKEQALKTLRAIKPETLAKYQQAIVIINKERSNSHGNQNQTLDS